MGSAAIGACGTGAGGGNGRSTVTVLAAASLAEVFGEIGRSFEAAHPDLSVRFSFAASSTVAAQVRAGAPADVVATADEATMGALAGHLASEPRVFAHNHLAVVVRPGNPDGIRALADLGRSDLDVVVCAPEVPCGRLAAGALARAGVAVTPRSYEADVRGVVTRVALGEADAGIAYATDASRAADRVTAVPLAPDVDVTTAYPVAVVAASRQVEGAVAFVDFVLGPLAQASLRAAGFRGP